VISINFSNSEFAFASGEEANNREKASDVYGPQDIWYYMVFKNFIGENSNQYEGSVTPIFLFYKYNIKYAYMTLEHRRHRHRSTNRYENPANKWLCHMLTDTLTYSLYIYLFLKHFRCQKTEGEKIGKTVDGGGKCDLCDLYM